MKNSLGETKKIKEGFVGQKMIVLPPNILHQFTANPLIRNFHLTAIGFYPHARYHSRERKTGSSAYILLYCIEGSGQINIANEQFELLPNTFFIIQRNKAHHYASSISDPWSIYWIHFAGTYADHIYKRYASHKLPAVTAIPYDEKRIEAFNYLFAILNKSYAMLEMEILNVKLLYFIASMVYYHHTNPSDDSRDAVSASIEFMHANLSKFLTIEALAGQQQFSISYYTKFFKQKTGSSPIQYFNQLKIQKSCQYLYFTDKSIKEICPLLGFEDPYYFSRVFKKLMGISPEKYRKLHKK